MPIQESIVQDDFDHVTLAIDDGEDFAHKPVYKMGDMFRSLK